MAVRWRETGEIVCAAITRKRGSDCYIDDRLHYELSVELGVLIEANRGMGWGYHKVCDNSEIVRGVEPRWIHM